MVDKFYAAACVFDQLEWSMKLWWPHCEALIAFLMAYSQTKKPELLDRFSQVYEYTFSHVSVHCSANNCFSFIILRYGSTVW